MTLIVSLPDELAYIYLSFSHPLQISQPGLEGLHTHLFPDSTGSSLQCARTPTTFAQEEASN